MSTSSPARLWWHLHPLSFLGAEPTALPDDAPVQHRLPRLRGWLDHVAALGADGLLLGPVFASSSHGYDTVDPMVLDRRLGDADDLATLVADARDRGISVALDGVLNHVGRDFGPFQDVLREGPGSACASWFRLRWPEPWAGPGSEPDYDTFEGHGGLVALDHGEPAVREWAEAVLARWAEVGVTAWRLDAAYAIPSGFLRAVTDAARSARPDSWFLGEVIHGDYGRIAAEGGLDAVTQYELWKAVWSGVADRNFFELAHAMGRHADFAAATTPQTFLGNHDVTRIASRVPAEHLPHCEVVLLTVPGVPSVYAGDENGLHAVKEERAGGDDAIRPAFPDDPTAVRPEVEGTFERYRDLAALRRRHDWLQTGRTEVLTLANEQLTYLCRPADEADGRRLLVALSLADGTAEPDLPDGAWHVELGHADLSEGRLVLAPHGWAVLGQD